MGVYYKEPLLCNGDNDKNISKSVKNPNGVVIHLILVFITFTKQQGCKDPCKIKHVTNFGKFKVFLERLKNSTQSIHSCVKTFDDRHDANRYRVSQGIVGSWRMHFFSVISTLNDSKFYGGVWNELA